jgi:hypothetical protein
MQAETHALDFTAKIPLMAFQLREKAFQAEKQGWGESGEGLLLWELVFSAALQGNSRVPAFCKLMPEDKLPKKLASPDHAVAQLSKDSIIFFALPGLTTGSMPSLQRFNVINEILQKIARRLSRDEVFECIVDFGDGCDEAGDYRRLAFCGASDKAVLIPDPYFFNSENYRGLRGFVADHAKPWQDRRDIVFWRGNANGHCIESDDPDRAFAWSRHQRLHLCSLAQNGRFKDVLDIGVVGDQDYGNKTLRDAIEKNGLTIERAKFAKPPAAKKQFLDYRYLVDVDGWSNAWSFLEKLIMGATVLKVESAFGYRQWYYDRLSPWEHYVPLKPDLSDFDAKLSWLFAMPEECARIAGNAASFAQDLDLAAEMALAERHVLPILQPVPQSRRLRAVG